MALYNIKAKTRNWSVRLKFHFHNFALSSALINCANGKHLDILKFRNQIAETLIKASATYLHHHLFACHVMIEKKMVDLPAAKQTHAKSPIIKAKCEGFGHLPLHNIRAWPNMQEL